MSELGPALGAPTAFRLGNSVLDVYPVRLKDWPKFSPVLFVLDLANLHEVHYFTDGPTGLLDMLRVVLRTEEIPEYIDEMTQVEYDRLRGLILQQNDIDFERLRKKVNTFQNPESEIKKD